MAEEKKLNTRIQLKYDSLENWETVADELVLKKGEIAVVAIPNESTEVTNPPAIVFKVGDGESTFGELPYASGLAADVYAWAKAENLNLSALTVDNNGKIEYQLVNGLDDDITGVASGLITTAIQEMLESETFAETVIQDVTESISESLNTAETYTDEAIRGLGSAEVEEGYYVTGVGVGEDGKLTLTAVKFEDAGYATTKYVDEQISTKVGEISGDTVADSIATAVSEAKTYTDEEIAKLDVENTYATKTELTEGLEKKQDTLTFDTTPTSGSENPVTSGGVYGAIADAIAGVTQFEVEVYDDYSNLPETGTKGVIYLVKHDHGDDDVYDEYIWSTDDNAYEKIGNTDINLSEYAKLTDLESAYTLNWDADTFIATLKRTINNETTDVGTLTLGSAAVASTTDFASASNFSTLSTTVGNLVTTVGDDDSGLVKDVADLKAAVGTDEESSGETLTDRVEALETTVGDTESGLVKGVADIQTTIEDMDYTDEAVSGQFVTAVSEENGVISVSRGTVSYNDLTDVPEGGDVVDVVAAENNGLTVTSTTEEKKTTFTIDWDEDIVFVLDCGSATDNT